MRISAADQKPFQSPEVRVVEASAGSGKTYALAKRYVQLILNPAVDHEQIPIRNILALTFTNKAAFEMKARILEFLKNIALKKLKPSEEQDILHPIGLDRDQASLKAYAVMEGVIRHYNFFQVQTIDKFINALLSGCAFKIGLTANFKIKTNSGEYLQYSLDQLIDQARQDKRILKSFEQFLHHYLYLENRMGWFPKKDILEIITALFEQSNTYGKRFREGPFSSDDCVKMKRSILSDIRKLRDGLPDQTHAGFLKSLDQFLAASQQGFDIDQISDYFAREEIPVKKGAGVPRQTEKLWAEIREQLKELSLSEAYSLFNPYIRLYSEAMEGFYAQAAKDDCLFLNELNKRAGDLFDENRVTVEELYYRLATRFHHYLVDEFQDTSRLQWHNLETMTEEALSTGGSLFYVGDRKQAIYGFRGGDVALFDDVKNTFSAFNANVDLLTNNWRSQKNIVEFNNTIFSRDNLEQFIAQKESYEREKKRSSQVHFTQTDLDHVRSIFESAQQTHQKDNDSGYVQLEYIDIDKKEERDEVIREKLTLQIQELMSRYSFKDIAILTRGNQEIKAITNWLLEANIPVESERTSDITENKLIQELAAFLRFLNSPIDNNAFAIFILGDLFTRASGLNSEELHTFVFKLRERLTNERDLYLYTEFRKTYSKVWADLIEVFFANVGLYPLYELLVTIYSRFNILTHCRGAQGFFMHFLELVKAQEEENADLRSFLDYFDELEGEDLYVHIPDSDAVKIMTVHKAKGLEFPVVILPFLGMDVQIGQKSGEYQPSYITIQQNDGIGLLRIKNKYRKFSDELSAIYAEEYKKAFISELNSIYVALTRPKFELYGYIPKRVGNSINLLRFLIPEELYELGKPEKAVSSNEERTAMREMPPPDYPDWIDYLKDEFLNIDELANREQKLKGEIMHFVLERVGNLSCEDKETVLKQAFDEASLQYTQIKDWPSLKDHIGALLEQEVLRPIFYCDDNSVITEKEVVDAHGYTKRCDRLIIRQQELWIVDYKSSRDDQGRDREQIDEYKEIMAEIYPNFTIKGFLVYLDEMKVQDV